MFLLKLQGRMGVQRAYLFHGLKADPQNLESHFSKLDFQKIAKPIRSIWSDSIQLVFKPMIKMTIGKSVPSRGSWRTSQTHTLSSLVVAPLKTNLRWKSAIEKIFKHRCLTLLLEFFQINIKSWHLKNFLFKVKDGEAKALSSPFQNYKNKRNGRQFLDKSVRLPGRNDTEKSETFSRAVLPATGLM